MVIVEEMISLAWKVGQDEMEIRARVRLAPVQKRGQGVIGEIREMV